MAVQPQIVGSLPSSAAQGLVNALHLPEESRGQLEEIIRELSEILRETAQNIPSLAEEDFAVMLPADADPAIREIWNRAEELIKQSAIVHFRRWTQNIEDRGLLGSGRGVVGTLEEPLPPNRFDQYRAEIEGFKNYIENLLIPKAAQTFAEQHLGMAIVWNVQQLTHEEWQEQVGRHPVGNLLLGYDRYLYSAFMIYICPSLIDPVPLFDQFQAQPNNPQNNQGNL